jgi:hypothetical protein
MGERDDSLRTIADARTRLSALAEELGRRAAPEHVKEVAREMATEQADHLKDRAREKARDKVDEMKRHVKEVAMRRTAEFKHEMTETPRGVGFLGALLGAGLGSTLARRFFQSRQHGYEYRGGWREGERDWGHERSGARFYSEDQRAYDVGAGPEHEVGWREREPGATWQQTHESEGPGMGERAASAAQSARGRASDTMQSAKERASDTMQSAKERVSETVQSAKERAGEVMGSARERASGMMGSARERASDLRERIPSRYEMREQARSWYANAAQEQPVALALGAFAFGALAAALLPVSSRERQVLEPARRKAEEAVAQAGGRIEERLGGVSGQEQGGERSSQASASSSAPAYNTYGTEETSARSGTDVSRSGSDVYSAARAEAGAGTREWNDRREVTSAEPPPPVTQQSYQPVSTPDASGTATPLSPLPSADDIGKVH